MFAQSRLLAMRKLSFRESGLLNQSAGTVYCETRSVSGGCTAGAASAGGAVGAAGAGGAGWGDIGSRVGV